jgi:hypothetical protein
MNTTVLANALNIHTRQVTIVAYCIGNFNTSKASYLQLLYLLEIVKKFRVKKVYFYDPMNTLEEIDYVRKMGFIYLKKNSKIKHSPNNIILYYMPFCDIKLYDLVLKQNFRHLDKIIIVGNGLHMYAKTNFTSPYIDKVYDYMNIQAVKADDYDVNRLQKVYYYITTFSK